MLKVETSERELCAAVERALVQMAASVRAADARTPAAAGEPEWAGWDSLSWARLANRICERYGLEIDAMILLDCPTVADLARTLVSSYPEAMRVVHAPDHRTERAADRDGQASSPSDERPAPRRAVREPVAIVGVSLRVPQAESLQQFWDALIEGRDCIAEVPSDRWDWSAIAGDPHRDVNRTHVRWGAFIDRVAEFDPLFFGISPKEAEVMDPQQRLVLMCGVAAIEDAGYAPGGLAGTRTGVFVGLVSNSGYEHRAAQAGRPIEGYSAAASAASMGPNRLSYWLDLRGPSEPVETTCSSSLVAIYRAMRAIQDGDCDMALAGGVNLVISPARHVSFSKAGMLSADGRCRPFSAAANGYVRGEGVAMLFLKRLAAAERDGDEVYAVLRGGAVNHGGRAGSFSAPNPTAQAALLVDAYTAAGIDPRTVGYIEAHGTGTPLGDPVEIDGLQAAFARLDPSSTDGRTNAWRCGLGSVKGNIGHLEAAAGVAGLLKVMAQLQHRTLARSLYGLPRNPRVRIEHPFFLVEETQPWPAPVDDEGRWLPRCAGVSSFGIGGVNAHVIVEEYVETRPEGAGDGCADRDECIVLSARDESRLRARASQLLDALRQGAFTEEDLPRIAYTLQIGRDAMTHRLGFLARSLTHVRETLAAIVDTAGDVAGVYRGVVPRSRASQERHGEAAPAALAEPRVDEHVLAWWVRGGHVDWSRFHPRPPRRIRLPVYPFARERYWIDLAPAVASGIAAATSPAAAPLHPLLHRNTSTLDGLRLTSLFTGEEPWLRDHVIGGRRVVPAAAYVEMARAAALIGHGRTVLRGAVLIQDVVWPRPLYVDAPQAVHTTVARRDDGRLDFEIYTERTSAEGGARTVHAQGCVALVDAPSEAEPGLDLPALRGRCTATVSAETHYGTVEADGVSYGPFYRGVQSVEIGTREDGTRFALAEVFVPPGIDAAGYGLHPAMIDGALQAMMALRRVNAEDGTRHPVAIPFAVGSLDVLSPVPASAVVFAHVRPVDDGTGDRGDGTLAGHLEICDPNGQVCVRLNGLILRLVERERRAAPVLLRPVWAPRPIGHRPAPGAASAVRHVWLTGGLADAADTLRLLSPHVTWHTLPGPATPLADFVVHAAGRVFAQLQAHMQATPAQHLVVQLVVPAGDDEAGSLMALTGLFKTAHQESPYVRGQVVLAEPMPMARLASVLAANARSAPPGDMLIRQQSGAREVVTWRTAEEDVATPVPPWRDAGVYLITGGSGRLARLLAGDILRHAPGAHVILASRTAAPPSAWGTAGIVPAGGSVTWQEMDVTRAASVNAAVRTILATHGRLTGLVHCAGVIHDNFIVRKPLDELRAVLAPKVEGILELDEATRSLPLECVLLFASIGGAVGNAGQSDYTTANAFLDWFAAYRNDLVRTGLRHGRTLAIDWPLWRDGGMRGVVGMRGSTPAASLATDAGLTALARAWGTGAAQVIVVPDGYARLSELQRHERTTAIAHVGGTAAAVAALPQEVNGDPDLQAFAIRLLARRVAALLEVEPERLDPRTPLEAYGLDSIAGLRVVSALEREFGRLPRTLFIDCPTLDALAHRCVEEHGEALRAMRRFEGADAGAADAGVAL